MPQFDVHRAEPEGSLIVDCQCDFLDDLATRIVIPLYRPDQADWNFPRLAPKIQFQDQAYVLATPDLATVAVRDMGPPLGSIADQRYAILNAIDFLLSGI